MIWLILINILFLILVGKYILDILLVVWCNLFYGVPYVPTKMKRVKELIRELENAWGSHPGGVKSTLRFASYPRGVALRVIELGSGDGRVSVEMVKRFKVKALGLEKNKLLLLMARTRAKLAFRKKGEVKFVNRDLFAEPLIGYNVVYIYLLPWMIEKLRQRFETDLAKGSLVISFDYPLESKKFKMIKILGRGKQKIAIYQKIK